MAAGQRTRDERPSSDDGGYSYVAELEGEYGFQRGGYFEVDRPSFFVAGEGPYKEHVFITPDSPGVQPLDGDRFLAPNDGDRFLAPNTSDSPFREAGREQVTVTPENAQSVPASVGEEQRIVLQLDAAATREFLEGRAVEAVLEASQRNRDVLNSGGLFN